MPKMNAAILTKREIKTDPSQPPEHAENLRCETPWTFRILC